MATNRAAQWAEPSGRTSAACVLDRTMRAAAAERARARRTARRIAASARSLTLRTARDGAESAARAWRRVRGLTRRETSADPQLSPWLASVGVAGLTFALTSAWPHAAIAGTCVFALSTLRAMQRAQRREALALYRQLAELRQALRVTQALLEVEVLDGAEHLDDEPDAASVEESGARRVPPQRVSYPKVG